MTQILRPKVAAAIASAIGTIPGCSMNTTGVLDLRMSPQGWGTSVRLGGWSPSLHSIVMQWQIVIGPYEDDERQIASALSSIAGNLDLQRTRAAAAMELPCSPSAFPLDCHGNRFNVMHLHADASALAVHIGDDDGRYVRSPPHTPEQAERHRQSVLATLAMDRMHALGTFVSDVHSASRDHDGGTALRGRDMSLTERRGERVIDWAQLIRTPGHRGTSGQGVIRGSTLTIDPVAIPDSLAGALVGKPLRMLVDIHPMVSPRTIRRIRTLASGSVSVTLAPAQVAMEDLRTMTVGDALSHLRGIIGQE